MRYEVPPVEGRLVARLNRFAVEVDAAGHRLRAHLPNSGRLRELLVAGAPCLLLPRAAPGRRTPYDLAAVGHGGRWVSVDARLPAVLMAEAVAAGRLRPFRGWDVVRREPRVVALWADGPEGAAVGGRMRGTPGGGPPQGGGRFDLELRERGTGRRCAVEAKSVTLVAGGEARFPDAPTERGRRHVLELARLAAAGERACVCFVVQRPDARWFAPNGATDPAFAAALAEAVTAGVEVYAWRCCTSPAGVIIRDEITVREVG